MSRAPNRKVFRCAARLIDAELSAYCCCALDDAAEELSVATYVEIASRATVEERVFHRLFMPLGEVPGEPYFGPAFTLDAAKNRERRVIALLLAAEIVRDMEDVP